MARCAVASFGVVPCALLCCAVRRGCVGRLWQTIGCHLHTQAGLQTHASWLVPVWRCVHACVTVQVPYMGMFESLMDPTYAPEVAYVARLVAVKRVANPWLQLGSATREVCQRFVSTVSAIVIRVDVVIDHGCQFGGL